MLNRVKVLGALPIAATALVLAMPSAASAATPSIAVSPATGLTSGQKVTVTGSNFPAGLGLFILQCSGVPSATSCDTTKLVTATTTAAGTFSATYTVLTGAVGSGTCKAGGTCYIAAGDAAQTAGGSQKIVFAAAAVTPPKTTTTTPAKSAPAKSAPIKSVPAESAPAESAPATTSGSGSSVPTAVSAGNGGGADRDRIPAGSLLLGAIGAAAFAATGMRLRRR